MSKNITLTSERLESIIAAAVAAALEPSAPAKVAKPAKAAKAPKAKKAMPVELAAARAHCRDARQARWENTPLGGLTKAQRQEIAATMRAAGKDAGNTRSWNAAVKAFKQGGFR